MHTMCEHTSSQLSLLSAVLHVSQNAAISVRNQQWMNTSSVFCISIIQLYILLTHKLLWLFPLTPPVSHCTFSFCFSLSAPLAFSLARCFINRTIKQLKLFFTCDIFSKADELREEEACGKYWRLVTRLKLTACEPARQIPAKSSSVVALTVNFKICKSFAKYMQLRVHVNFPYLYFERIHTMYLLYYQNINFYLHKKTRQKENRSSVP